MLTGTCGEEHYYSPGGAPDTPGAFKKYVVDVTASGTYDFLVGSTTPGTIFGSLQNCDRLASNWLTETSPVPLDPGRHVLTVGFPQDAGVQGQLELQLIWRSP